MRPSVFLGLVLVLALPAVPASAATVPFVADLNWDIAQTSGRLNLEGGAWTLHMPSDPGALLMGSSTHFTLQAEFLRVQYTYRDFVGTSSLGLVGRDTSWHASEDRWDGSSLLFDAAREDGQFMVVPGDGAAPPVRLESSVSAAALEAVPTVGVDFFENLPSAFDQGEALQRHARHEAPAVRFSTPDFVVPTTVEGDFRIFLWEIDLQDATADRQGVRSGILRSGPVGSSPATPDGVLYEARVQLATLDVHQGRLQFLVPGHVLNAYLDPPSSRIAGPGTWDLSGAAGILRFAGDANEVAGEDLRLEGTFDVAFEALSDGSAVRTHWTGHAQAAESDALSLQAPTRAAGGPSWPMMVVLGAVVLGLTGASTAALRRTPRPNAAEPTLSQPLLEGDFHEALKLADDALDAEPSEAEALLNKGIALLKLGRAEEVVSTLEPGYDPASPEAPIRAYLLGRAFLDLGRFEEATHWTLKACNLYPEFRDEVAGNEAFDPIRNDPRIRKFLGVDQSMEGDTGYA